MKIEEQVLSREQMAHLKELGIDTSDASMYWSYENSCGDRYWVLLPYDKDYGIDEETIPTYTIGDLIKKLPKHIDWYELSICWKNECVEYDNWISEEVTGCIGDFNFENRPLIEALYDCLCWVAENHKELI